MRRRNVEQQHAGALGKNQLIRIRVRRWIRRLRSSLDGNAGHSNISITMDTYTYVLPELQRQAADAMDRALGGRSLER